MLDRPHKVAIVGAGMTGLTAADYLTRNGVHVQVFDKGRARGGRISTRRTAHGTFDYGAPAIQAEKDEFRAFLASHGASIGACGALYGTPTMRSIFDTLGDGLPIRQEVRIARLSHEPSGWALRTAGGKSYAFFDDVVVAMPAPQARDLVRDSDPELADALNHVRMQPVWSCLVRFEQPLPELSIGPGGPIMRADRMGDRPGRTNEETCWVIHMNPSFTELHLHADPAVIAPFILQTFAEYCDISLPNIVYLNAHRWRYAFADQPLGRPFLASQLPGLYVGGDWTLGRRAEHGFESGVAMAKSVLSRVAAPV